MNEISSRDNLIMPDTGSSLSVIVHLGECGNIILAAISSANTVMHLPLLLFHPPHRALALTQRARRGERRLAETHQRQAAQRQRAM